MTVALCYQHLQCDNGLTMLTTPAGDAKVEKETDHSPEGVWRRIQMWHRISAANLLIAFHSNYGSILLSLRDMTLGRIMDRQMDDRLTSLISVYLQASSNSLQYSMLVCYAKLADQLCLLF